jgi:hypothetical protein
MQEPHLLLYRQQNLGYVDGVTSAIQTQIDTKATGTVNFDASTQGVLYYTTDASANWTLKCSWYI